MFGVECGKSCACVSYIGYTQADGAAQRVAVRGDGRHGAGLALRELRLAAQSLAVVGQWIVGHRRGVLHRRLNRRRRVVAQ